MTIPFKLSGWALAIFFAAVAFSSTAVQSQSGFSFQTFQVPGSTQTAANGVNNHGVIVGWAAGGDFASEVGFSFTPDTNTYQIISCPGSTRSGAEGINDNNVVVGACTINGVITGFGEQDGNFTLIAFPGASSTECLGINNLGQIVGNYRDSTGGHGFVYANGKFKSIRHGSETIVYGINNTGELVGSSVPGRYAHGFIKLKHFESIIYPAPGTRDTSVNGVNDTGDLVGDWRGPVPDGEHGFLFINSDSSFVAIDLGDGTETSCRGINNSGEIVGFYTISGGGNNFYGFYAQRMK